MNRRDSSGPVTGPDTPRDAELRDLFTSATDDVVLRRGVEEVLADSRGPGARPSPAAPSARRAALASLAVAAVVAGIIGVGVAVLPEDSSGPAPAGQPTATPDTPAPSASAPDARTARLTFYVAGRSDDAGLVSRASPAADVGDAIIASVRGEGSPAGSGTAWTAEDRLGITVSERGPGSVVVDLVPRGGVLARSTGLFDEPGARRLALQQVAWTARAYRGPGTEVRFLVNGSPAGRTPAARVPDVVSADPDAFAPLQVVRRSPRTTRDAFDFGVYSARPGRLRYALVSVNVDVDPFEGDGDLTPGVPFTGSEPLLRDPVTGRYGTESGVSFDSGVPPGDYSIVFAVRDVRASVPVTVVR